MVCFNTFVSLLLINGITYA